MLEHLLISYSLKKKNKRRKKLATIKHSRINTPQLSTKYSSLYKLSKSANKRNYGPLLKQRSTLALTKPGIGSKAQLKPSFNRRDHLPQQLSKLSLKITNSTKKHKLTYISLFLRFRLLVLNYNFKSKKFLVKKQLFSFLKLNEAKRNIMNRRKRISTFRFYKTLAKFNYSTVTTKASNAFRNFTKDRFFSANSGSTNLMRSYKGRTSSELFLPRVKFKPGYQRIWRQARRAIAENIGLRYVYQKQMTKYMLRLSKRVNTYSFSMSEASLDKAILYSRLLPDLKTTSNFLALGLISLNGWKINKLSSFVMPGDLIQVTLSRWLSVYFRWLVVWANQNKAKFKKLVFRKGLASSYKLMKQRKQRSRHVPLWVYNSRFDMSDIKPNYEVDFFTMSSFVLYEPLLIDYYTPDDLPDQRHYIYRLYNWKYIT
jgi:hypothetical protein